MNRITQVFSIAILLGLTSCYQSPEAIKAGLPAGVDRFRDGNVTCYIVYEHGISCVKDSIADELNK